ncbi:Ppx/GppA family phosphatase [Priestia abyssalis]|uniref:Ppx/GppA family phosphatase n=1 Tax=Priestia abyssalis TaxID=1221450 RepID=UPI0014743F20|nr:Ppx/GppA family phosphatase [Priestia abyssalis]
MLEQLSDKYAMIDIGSNTMRLVIYEHDSRKKFKQLENVKVVARLRNYLNEEQQLSEEGINVLIDTLCSFQIITRHHSVQHVKCVATATVRQADNREEICRLVQKLTDFEMTILSEYEEAFYGFLAVVNSTDIPEGITIDIGGGSTEITYFLDRQLIEYHSFPFGALSLQLQYVKEDTPTEEERKAIKQFVQSQFETIPWLHGKQVPIVAIGGSARNMVQLHQSFIHYPLAGVHQYEMMLSDIQLLKKQLSGMNYQELQRLEGLSKDRADTILPAMEVFESLCELTEAPRFILSRKGLREGLMFEELIKPLGIGLYPNVLEESFQELVMDFEIDTEHVTQVTKIASLLFQHFRMHLDFPMGDKDLSLLKRAAQVFHLGEYIDSESSSQHTFYLLANRTIDGIRHKDRLKLALLASYKGKSAFRQYMEPFKDWLTKEEQKTLRFLGAVLKFASSLNATKRNIVKHLDIDANSTGFTIKILCCSDYRAEEYQAEKQKKHLEKVTKQPIVLQFQKL